MSAPPRTNTISVPSGDQVGSVALLTEASVSRNWIVVPETYAMLPLAPKLVAPSAAPPSGSTTRVAAARARTRRRGNTTTLYRPIGVPARANFLLAPVEQV